MHCFCEHTAMMIQEQHNNNLSVRHKSLDFDTTASLFWKLVALPLLHAKCTCLSNTYQAYDASRRSKRHAAQMGRVVQVSGIAHLVGVQRAVQNNANVKSEPKYLACEESPICAFYFWTICCSSVALLASVVDWLFCFFFPQSCLLSAAFSTRLCTWLRKICTLQRASRAVLPVLCRQETSFRRCHVMYVSNILPGREHKLTFWAWPQIDIPKRYRKFTFLSVTDTYVRTYVYCENRFLI